MALLPRLWLTVICYMVSVHQVYHYTVIENLLIQQITKSITKVRADYIFQVRTVSYNNLEGKLINGDCCLVSRRFFFTQTNCVLTACNIRFYYCLKSTSNTDGGCVGGITSETNLNNERINFNNQTVLGLPNPLQLQGLTREWTVSQNYN